jgi:hypothetical protein
MDADDQVCAFVGLILEYQEVACISVVFECLLQRGRLWMEERDLRGALARPLDFGKPALRSSYYHSDPVDDEERAAILAGAEARARAMLSEDEDGEPQPIDERLISSSVRESLEYEIALAKQYGYSDEYAY